MILWLIDLSPEPASMFTDEGMRTSTSKATLKNKVEISARHVAVDVTFLDGCAVMWVVPWPSNATVPGQLSSPHLQLYSERSCVSDL